MASAPVGLATPYGLFLLHGQVALTFRRYVHKHKHKLTSEDLAKVVLAFQANANRNPNAVM